MLFVQSVRQVMMKSEYKVEQGKQDRISRDSLVKSVQEGAGYTKIHIRLNILTPGKLRNPATSFPPRCQIKYLFYFNFTLL